MRFGWVEFVEDIVLLIPHQNIAQCMQGMEAVVVRVGKHSRTKMLYVGSYTSEGGVIWKRLEWFSILPARVFRFRFVERPDGVSVEGQLTLRPALRWPVGTYLTVCCIALPESMWEATQVHAGWPILGPILGFLMIAGWTWMAVRLNRKAENVMLRALQYAMSDIQSAAILGDVLGA